MRSYEMTEIGERAQRVPDRGIHHRHGRLRRGVPVRGRRRVRLRTPRAPGPGGITARQLLDAVRRINLELPVVGVDVVEVSPPYDHAEITRSWRTASSWKR